MVVKEKLFNALMLFVGYIVEGGVTRHPFGGEKVADSLKQSLTRLHYHFFSEVERLIIRLVMEKVSVSRIGFSVSFLHMSWIKFVMGLLHKRACTFRHKS